MEHSRNTTLCIIFIAFIYIKQARAHAENPPQDFLAAHNNIRSPIGLPPFTWNTTLEAYAQEYAATRTDCAIIHSGGPYGENIAFAGWNFTAADAMQIWASEVEFYDYDSNTCAEGKECHHYTQVVWRDTTDIGCATVDCDNEGWSFISCNYYPMGNCYGVRPY